MSRSDLVPERRGTAGAQLISRMEPLLGTDVCQVSRRPGHGRGQMSWVVVPSLKNPRVLLPPGAPAASFLLRSSGTGKSAVHLRLLAWLQRRTALGLLPLPKLTVTASGHSAHLLDALNLVFPRVTDVAVRLGRPRHNRPWILLPITADGAVAAVVKTAAGEARGSLEREFRNLKRVHDAAVAGLHSPAPLGYWSVGELDLLAMEPLLTSQPQAPRPVPVGAMHEVARLDGTSWHRVDTAPFVGAMRRRADELTVLRDKGWVAEALSSVVDHFGDLELPLGSWHGDWVPWNMARHSDQVLVWDWEHLESGVPLGWDHVHYLAQDLRGRLGVERSVEKRWLQESTEALTQDWGLRPSQATASLLLYLVAVNLRFLTERPSDDPGGSERLGWARPFVESLVSGLDVEERR